MRRDTQVAVDMPPPADQPRAADVIIAGAVKAPQTIDLTKSKAGRAIEIALTLPPEIASLVSDGAANFRIVSFADTSVSMPVSASDIARDSKANALVLTFDWWSIVRHSPSGAASMTIQFELADGRLAQSDVMMRSSWKLS